MKLSNKINKMKSISIMNSDAIRNHPSNSSKSKNAYRFSQSKRFPDPNPECKLAFYANDSQLSNRKASFGYGTKVDFTKDRTCSPPATKYNPKTFLEESSKSGKSFGLNREKVVDKSFYLPSHRLKLPGPGMYNDKKESQNNLSFTMRNKTLDVIDKQLTYKANPGPGAYEQLNLGPKTGRFSVSKYADAKFSKINPTSPRFQTIKDSPGPNYYTEKDNLSSNGKYILSNHKGAGTRAFGQTIRSNFTDQFRKTGMKFPGPGEYQPPSQFGVYGDAQYYKTMKDFNTVE